ncbi:hypothetical protein TOPH_04889 [Tolypocladium ophioglossoides CBS 100239]|uniref:Uncharacterized protein n=1 Tax=Tolypocladium ophioglossoides (strain CBS 100239) TaxID=1163406 RepID=A0A0L0N8G2_TOLOC|nr:hypothetical protein TOPH_04889 [Tolypocladium ophioglossoides CBS 100239]
MLPVVSLALLAAFGAAANVERRQNLSELFVADIGVSSTSLFSIPGQPSSREGEPTTTLSITSATGSLSVPTGSGTATGTASGTKSGTATGSETSLTGTLAHTTSVTVSSSGTGSVSGSGSGT